ncbi:MAG: hypothetical protein ACD_2C00266G0011 [uncultured bacterium (gcode 4)]|uniref:5'-deoxynucleotidase n=1 Tax=uncultured bacterium (gcode 4) TaxID=1234023 RepID=K2GZG0_9BACT|nr:MAG: hypothetical protein ACD_2C00266G0011 [uncultured bacterium (gcode 4)]
MNRDTQKIYDFMQFLQNMKENKRWRNTPAVIFKESIADHSWKALVMAYCVWRQLDLKMDFFHVIKLVLVHDLVEAIAEDTDYRLVYLWLVSKDDKHAKEAEAIAEIREMLPSEIGDEIYGLWNEYEEWSTSEARFAKFIEKIESIDHVLYYWADYIDIPDKIAWYCKNALNKCPELRWFYAWYVGKLKELYLKSGFVWKESYEVEWEYEEFEDFDKFFWFFQVAQKLKETTRYGSSPLIPKKDSVAEHCYRLAFMAFVSAKWFNRDINISKAIYIAIFHDIIEALTWDLDYILIYTWQVTKAEKHINELGAMKTIKGILPQRIWDEIEDFWKEFEAWTSPESRFVKALDKYESISHLVFHTYENFDDPDLIAMYCDKPFQLTPELNPLYKLLKSDLKTEYAKWWKEWKEEYDNV